MDARTFESIQNKIETLKQKRAKAEGAIESIEENWKSNYGFSTVEEAENGLAKLQQDLEILEKDIEDLYRELTGLTNWNLI